MDSYFSGIVASCLTCAWARKTHKCKPGHAFCMLTDEKVAVGHGCQSWSWWVVQVPRRQVTSQLHVTYRSLLSK